MVSRSVLEKAIREVSEFCVNVLMHRVIVYSSTYIIA